MTGFEGDKLQNQKEKMKMKKYYVTMIDTFMSGWGRAEGKNNRLTFECKDLEEAYIVEDNANNRSEMSQVEIVDYEPEDKDDELHQVKTKEEYNNFYKKDAFI